MSPLHHTADEVIARLASSEQGVVTRAELLEAGLSAAQVRRRVRSGALLPEYPGVYRVGHRAPSIEARYMAAVKACGRGALLCGRAAAYLWELMKGAVPPPEVAVGRQKRLPGVTTRRSTPDATRWRGIPIATVPWTLVDLAAVLDAEELARAVHEATVRYRTTPEQVERVLARRPNAKGGKALRAVLRGDERVLLSRLERRFVALLRAEGLPLPVTNRVASGRYVDCRWPERKLTVELDSYRYHGSRHAWERDRRREREAYARGDDFRRYTYGDVLEAPAAMLRELRTVI
jgi:hypothetical protein